MLVKKLIELLSKLPEDTEINDFGVRLEDEENNRVCIYPPSIIPLTWSVEDFKDEAKRQKGKNWRDVYDETLFEDQLDAMIDHHDADWGISWKTVSFYLNGYCLKEEEK